MATGDADSRGENQQENATSHARQDPAEGSDSLPLVRYRERDWEFVRVDGVIFRSDFSVITRVDGIQVTEDGDRVRLEGVRDGRDSAQKSVYLRPEEARDQFVENADLAEGSFFWSVFLRPAESQDQFVTRADLANGKVVWKRMDERSQTLAQRDLDLNEPADKALFERLMESGGSVRAAPVTEQLWFCYADGYMRTRADLTGTKPQPREWRMVVSKGDERVRLKLPNSHGIRVPLAVLESVPVRLKGREREGVYFLRQGDRYQLIAAKAGGENVVEVSSAADVFGEYAYQTSYTLGKILFPVERKAFLEEMTGLRPPPSPPQPTTLAPRPLDTLSRYGISPLPSEQIKNIEVGPGDQLIDKITALVKQLPPKTPLVINQWGFFDNPGPDNRVAHELVSAVCTHAATKGPVDLILTPGKLIPSMEDILSAAGVRVHFAHNLTHPMVVHQKSIVTPDQAIIYTGPFAYEAGKRMEAMVVLDRDLSKLYYQYESLALDSASSVEQQKLLARLANKGVLINRPDIDTAYTARSYWALARGAEKSLDLYVKELADPEFTQLLLERAKAGVKVNLWLSEPEKDLMDKPTQRLIREARTKNPALPIEVKHYEWNQFPYTHFNSIIADGRAGAFGSLYPWSSALGQIDPPGGSTEHGVVLVGTGLVRMQKAIVQAQKVIQQSGRGTFEIRDTLTELAAPKRSR